MAKARSKHRTGSKKQVERKPRGASIERKALQVIFDAYLAKHVADRAIVRPAANLAKAGDLRSRKEKTSKRSNDR